MRQLLNTRIDIVRPTNTSGNNMGISQTLTDAYEDIPASVQPATSSIRQYYAQRQLTVTQTIFVAGTLELQRGDRITEGSTTYNFVGVRDLSGRRRVTAIDCEVVL